jgi:hypothetical protein
MKSLSLRVLQLFGEMGKDRLDLHALFEAAGNKSNERGGVFDAIDELTRRVCWTNAVMTSTH